MRKKLTNNQNYIVELMQKELLSKYERVCCVGMKRFNCNSVNSLIKKDVIIFEKIKDEKKYYKLSKDYLQ